MQLDTKLSVTWKVHAVTAHLTTFLDRHGRGLADVCEQTGESSHHAMVPWLERHKVAEDNPAHGEKQLNAVVKFGSWNVFNMSGEKRRRRRVKKSGQ